MNVQSALKGQYHAGLKMMRQCVEQCPEDVWRGGTHPRNPWRIAYHAAFYTHLYLQPSEHDFTPWEKTDKSKDTARILWAEPPLVEPYTGDEILSYIDELDANVDGFVDALDLDADQTGFSWYPGMAKLDHQILNIRHLQGHVGQLSEILMALGIDTDWKAL